MTSLLLFLLAAAPASPPAGIYFEQTTFVRDQSGAAAPGVRSRVWCAGPRMRLEGADAPGGTALVLRLDERRALRLDPEARVATELDLSRLQSRSQSDAAVTGGLLTTPGASELRTTAIEGRRTIAGHLCRGFRISGSTATIDTWVTADLPVRADLFADFLEWSGATQALPGLVTAIRALPGFPLETRMRVSVLGTPQETVSTITAVRAMAVPAERFEVPAGWRIVKEEPPKEVPR